MASLAAETRYKVSALAHERAAAFGEAIDEAPQVASEKFQKFAKAYLSSMEVGQEQLFPIPATSGGKHSFILKKLSDEEFSIRVVD